VAEHLGDAGGVLVFGETGFLKKGPARSAYQRQYSGTAGRVENCQLGVFLGYTARHSRTLIERDLYLPKSWIADRDGCRSDPRSLRTRAGVLPVLRVRRDPSGVLSECGCGEFAGEDHAVGELEEPVVDVIAGFPASA
jgi:hypothetical protein